MTEEEALFVAPRVSNMPTPHIPSFKVPCTECGEDVWIDSNMEKYWSKARIVCLVCALKSASERRGPHTIKIVPENITGIIKYLLSRWKVID